ncbi:hypothetical protein [Kribbella catacumbae]|uniref:hypothetical protein n=1 Tax=Kribbella catacumbae TaxID=460086 RepID=UPI000374CD06|nr:hypothetical protein [Kribbella catacumbae]
MSVPVALNAGSNTIRLSKPANGGYVQLDALDLSLAPAPVYVAISPVAVPNAGFESNGATQTPDSWST